MEKQLRKKNKKKRQRERERVSMSKSSTTMYIPKKLSTQQDQSLKDQIENQIQHNPRIFKREKRKEKPIPI